MAKTLKTKKHLDLDTNTGFVLKVYSEGKHVDVKIRDASAFDFELSIGDAEKFRDALNEALTRLHANRSRRVEQVAQGGD